MKKKEILRIKSAHNALVKSKKCTGRYARTIAGRLNRSSCAEIFPYDEYGYPVEIHPYFTDKPLFNRCKKYMFIPVTGESGNPWIWWKVARV